MNDIGYAIAGSPSNRSGQATQALAAPSEMTQRLQTLQGAITALYGVVDDLHMQLRPVLQEVPSKPAPQETGAMPKSNVVVGQLDQQVSRISELIDQLRGIRTRLHV